MFGPLIDPGSKIIVFPLIFRVEKRSDAHAQWYNILSNVVESSRGKFCLFYDHDQQVDNFPTGLPVSCGIPVHSLTQNLRNGKSIARYAVEQLGELDNTEYRKMLRKVKHSFEGEVEKIPCDLSKLDSTVISQLLKVLDEGYSFGDIAVLWSAKRDIPDKWKYEEDDDDNLGKKVYIGSERTLHVGDACKESRNVIVIDTIRRFNNMDRTVVILVNPQARGPADPQRFMYSAITRAISKLILINPDQAFWNYFTGL